MPHLLRYNPLRCKHASFVETHDPRKVLRTDVPNGVLSHLHGEFSPGVGMAIVCTERNAQLGNNKKHASTYNQGGYERVMAASIRHI